MGYGNRYQPYYKSTDKGNDNKWEYNIFIIMKYIEGL